MPKSVQSDVEIRMTALDHAVRTHGRHMGDDVAHSKRVLDAASQYEAFLCGNGGKA